MLRSHWLLRSIGRQSRGIRGVSPKEGRGRLWLERFAEKEGQYQP